MAIKNKDRQIYQQWLNRTMDQYKEYPIIVPQEIMGGVPEGLHDEIKSRAKDEVISMYKERARQIIVKINSPFKKELMELKVNYRNFYRQLANNKAKLSLYKTGALKEEIKEHELLYLIDKLDVEMQLMEEELSWYGLTQKEVLNGPI